MEDLPGALLRLADAFPDDLGPAADPFTLKDPFDDFVYYSRWTFNQAYEEFVDRMLAWTPRILRLLTGGRLAGYEGYVSARFLEAGWREWPPHQRAAVEDVLRAWWTATVTEYPSALPIAEVLAIVTQMTGDVRPWLTTWSTSGAVAAAHQFRDFIHAHLPWSHHIYDFDRVSAEDAINRWLLRDGVAILAVLPPGPDLDAALTELAQQESQILWWL
jgi:hypothetical protein